jgi:UDP-N-acetylmuramoylalanine--D-glutamate ligase
MPARSVTAYDRRPAAELLDAVAALEGRPVGLALGVDVAEATSVLADADLLVTSPSISPRFPTTDPWLREALVAAEARGAELVSEVGLFLRLTRARVVAVTGTKGKTTTASLVAAMLQAADLPVVLGGNIGTPLIERATALGPKDWAVLELSELQLPTIDRGGDDRALHEHRRGPSRPPRQRGRLPCGEGAARRADGAVGVGGAQRTTTRAVASSPAASIRRESRGTESRPRRAPARGSDRRRWLDDPWRGSGFSPRARSRSPAVTCSPTSLGAALAAHLAGADGHVDRRAIRAFPGVPHRLETIADRAGVRWINDSQATIPAAAIAALRAFDAPIVLVCGGKDKGLDYAAFADEIVARARACVLIGETAAELERLIGARVATRSAPSMLEAVRLAASLAEPGDVVLLSPAAASFDMFVDYAARGDAFREAVAGLEDPA